MEDFSCKMLDIRQYNTLEVQVETRSIAVEFEYVEETIKIRIFNKVIAFGNEKTLRVGEQPLNVNNAHNTPKSHQCPQGQDIQHFPENDDIKKDTAAFDIVPVDFTSKYAGKQSEVESMSDQARLETSVLQSTGRKDSLNDNGQVHFPKKAKKRKHYECEYCDKVYKSISSVKIHMTNVHSDKKYVCLMCDGIFVDKLQLQEHKRITPSHKSDKPYTCSVCGKSYATRPMLHQHKKTHTNRPFECEMCKKTFAGKSHYEAHLLRHTGERPFPCEVCEKAFQSKGHLKEHMFRHTNIRNVKCPECPKTFKLNKDLQIHLKIHSHVKPYRCDFCGKTFRFSGNLKEHILTHTDERKFTCSVCGKTFRKKFDLERHNMTHTGEKPHVCPTCNQGFSQKSSLNVHMLTHTGEKPHVCHICGWKFTQAGSLTQHLKNHEREDSKQETQTSDLPESSLLVESGVPQQQQPLVSYGPSPSEGYNQFFSI